MAYFSADAVHSRPTDQRQDDLIAAVILRLSYENEALTKELMQLRAAIRVHAEWETRPKNRRRRVTGEACGTL